MRRTAPRIQFVSGDFLLMVNIFYDLSFEGLSKIENRISIN